MSWPPKTVCRLVSPPLAPPLTAVKFMSDAAGAALSWNNGVCKNFTEPGDRGVASVGFKNSKGRWWGSKSNALECVGLLLPFVTNPKLLKNRFVILYVDNISLIYAWEKKYCKNDEETSILIRCLHVLEAFLEAKVFVEHVKRMSNDMAVLVDHLSRESSTTARDLERIGSVPRLSPGGALLDWIAIPCLDWNLPNKLIIDVQNLI